MDRTCVRCGTIYPAHLVKSAFRAVGRRVMRDASRITYRTLICRPCDQTARDRRKLANRWAVKARDVIRRHAIRLETSKQDLISIYGWDPDRLAHDAEFQYGNGCNYCGHQYKAMGHGLADITLDIMDRSQAPYYRTNTKWCCQTCNRKKGDKTPAWFECDRQVYALWAETRAAVERDPQEAGFLFALSEVSQ